MDARTRRSEPAGWRFAVFAALLFGLFAALRAAPQRAVVWHDEVFTQVFAAGRGGADWLPLFDGEIRPVRALRHARTYANERTMFETARALAREEPQHPPAYYLLARAWAGAYSGDSTDVNVSAHWLRWLSVIGSFLSLIAAYWLGTELSSKRSVRRWLPLFVALSPLFVLFALEAREYALWCFAFVAASAALLRARRTNAPRDYALYGGLMAFSFYTALSSVSIAIAHTLFVLIEEGPWRTRRISKELRAFALSGVFAFALFSPWAYCVFEHWEALQASTAWASTIEIPRVELVATLVLNLGRSFFDANQDTLFHWGALPIALGLALILTAAFQHPSRSSVRFLLCLFVAPLLLLFVPDLLSGGIRSISTRYLLPSLLALLGLGALQAERRPIATIALAGCMLISSLWVGRQETPWTKGISRELPAIARLVEQSTHPLIVADHERHHPGNMLALSGLLDDDVFVQLLPSVENYQLADHPGAVFLFSPSPRFVDELAAQTDRDPELLLESQHASLWRVR